MQMKIFYPLSFFLALLFLGSGYSQNISPDKIVDVKVKTSIVRLKKEGIIDVSINLNIMHGWHINSNKPLDNNLSPTSIKIKNNANFKVIKIKFPPPLLKKLGFSDSDLALYEDEVSIKVELKPVKKVTKGKIKVEGEVDYQPCNDQTCLFPVSKPFSFILR
ncbi:MAG: protein-disulfide reductase DsbD domain-containing protein [Ignavibacteriaceae bacterium]